MRYWISFLVMFLPFSGFAAESICASNAIGNQATAPTARYVFPTAKTIVDSEVLKDLVTGLVWARCEVGGVWDPIFQNCAKDGSQPTPMNWPNALAYVKALEGTSVNGYTTGWRLPNIKELASLIEHDCIRPALNGEVFKDALGNKVWTNSPTGITTASKVWAIDFELGTSGVFANSESHYIRLVRDSL